MDRYAYYEQLKAQARQVRQQYGLQTPRVLRSDLRRIYKDQGIRLDLWPHKLKNLRGAYFYDDLGATIMIARHLPPEPRIFTMAHELKHHLVDRELGISYCDVSNEREPIEIGAEIFAAELIFPDQDFKNYLLQLGVRPGNCTAENLVHLKHETQTTMSYSGLVKKATFLGFAPQGAFTAVKWRSLEAQIYGPPIYKRFRRT